MWTSSAIPYISLFCHQQTHTVIFIFFSSIFIFFSYFPTFIFTLYVPCFLFLLIKLQSKVSVVNQMSHLFFGSSKIFFYSFQYFENGHILNVLSTLIKVMKLDVEISNIVSMLSNVVSMNAEIDNVDLMLFNVVNFNVDIHNVVSALIWHCPTSRRHITLTTTLRPRWKVFWVLTNVAKRLHNFLKFIKLKKYTFSRIPLNCRLVFTRSFDSRGNLENVKEKPTRKTCFSPEKKRLTKTL